MTQDEMFAELVARGFCTAAQAAEAGHPVTEEGRRRRSIHWAKSSDPDVRAAFEAGRLHGLDEADRELIASLARMLGNERTTTIRAAADWHERDRHRAELRRRYDAGDPDLLEQAARERDRFAAANHRRTQNLLEEALRIPPVRGWEGWKAFCSEEVWDRIAGEFAAAGHPLPSHLTADERHLRAVA